MNTGASGRSPGGIRLCDDISLEPAKESSGVRCVTESGEAEPIRVVAPRRLSHLHHEQRRSRLTQHVCGRRRGVCALCRLVLCSCASQDSGNEDSQLMDDPSPSSAPNKPGRKKNPKSAFSVACNGDVSLTCTAAALKQRDATRTASRKENSGYGSSSE